MLSSVLLLTDSDKDIKLSNTFKVLRNKEMSTINSFHLYTVSDKIRMHKVYSLSLISEIECKIKIDTILVIKGDIYCTGEGKLIKNMKESTDLENDLIVKELINIDDMIGIQTKDLLLIYDLNLVKVKEVNCQVSYFLEGILLTAHKNHLIINIKERTIDFYIEEDITCLTCDLLFSRIFCGTTSGKIYQINMDGKSNKILDYHKTAVKFIKMSVCNKYVYSVDEVGEILVWDEIVIDRVKDVKVNKMEVFIN